MDDAIQDFLLTEPLRYMSQCTMIYKYGKRTLQLQFKKELKIFPQETMVASETHFALELNEKEVIESLENASPRSIKKAAKYGIKIFQGRNLKTLF